MTTTFVKCPTANERDAGNTEPLRKLGEVAEGRFDPDQAWFMALRHP